MWKHCPGHISRVVGYRTGRSMKNNDTWRFANEFAGKLWWKAGILLLILTVLIHIPFYGAEKDAIGSMSIFILTIQVIIMIGTIFPVEMALKNHFHEDGTRR